MAVCFHDSGLDFHRCAERECSYSDGLDNFVMPRRVEAPQDTMIRSTVRKAEERVRRRGRRCWRKRRRRAESKQDDQAFLRARKRVPVRKGRVPEQMARRMFWGGVSLLVLVMVGTDGTHGISV